MLPNQLSKLSLLERADCDHILCTYIKTWEQRCGSKFVLPRQDRRKDEGSHPKTILAFRARNLPFLGKKERRVLSIRGDASRAENLLHPDKIEGMMMDLMLGPQ